MGWCPCLFFVLVTTGWQVCAMPCVDTLKRLHWHREVDRTAWEGRAGHAVVSDGDTLYLFGGVSWTEDGQPFRSRGTVHETSAATFTASVPVPAPTQSTLVLKPVPAPVAPTPVAPTPTPEPSPRPPPKPAHHRLFQDLWVSSDATSWVKASAPPWQPRAYHQGCFYRNRVWLFWGAISVSAMQGDSNMDNLKRFVCFHLNMVQQCITAVCSDILSYM